jgi:polyhydroxyalkanoate synthase
MENKQSADAATKRRRARRASTPAKATKGAAETSDSTASIAVTTPTNGVPMGFHWTSDRPYAGLDVINKFWTDQWHALARMSEVTTANGTSAATASNATSGPSNGVPLGFNWMSDRPYAGLDQIGKFWTDQWRALARMPEVATANGTPAVTAAPAVSAPLNGTAQVFTRMIERPYAGLDLINKFWTEQWRVLAGMSDVAPGKDDHRFDDPTWKDNPYYRATMQTYLSLRDTFHAWIDSLPIEHAQAERLRFIGSLVGEALSPSNWSTNPAALRRYFETGGQSAIAGWKNMIEDAVHNGGMPSMAKRDALQVGRDMATTPGKVVHRTEVFELIQYVPTTKDVHARPYLMVPPQINKYYFYDLSEKKSLIRFALDAGLQTFTISWRNPGPQHRDWNFDTYLAAIEQAIDVVREITGSPDINIEGGCVAGLDVVAVLADLAQRGERKVHSATLMVTLLDTSADTQLNLLATPRLLELAKMNSRMHAVMDGGELGKIFAFLRPNDLIWNYWINNYLLGKDPPSFDVLAWNADTSRMTGAFHCDLLDLVQHNPIVKGEFKVQGRPIDVGAVECDQFWMGGLADHITPWPSCYASSRLTGGRKEFVVSHGGHIQSMIDSPANPKAKYFVNDAQPASADAWFEGATEHDESWWLRWRQWITRRSGKLRAAPSKLGSRQHPVLCDAPGTYVFD